MIRSTDAMRLSSARIARIVSLCLLIWAFIGQTQALTLDERNELFRRFKYYLTAVKPNTAPNRITTINGTFFALRSELQLLSTSPDNRQINVELAFLVNFVDDRLILRELKNRFQLPQEFRPWLPELATYPHLPWTMTVYLDPRNGLITTFYRLQAKLPCKSDIWRHPFEIFYCDLTITNGGDERLLLQGVRDLRTVPQQQRVHFKSSALPNLTFHFSYAHKWHSALISSMVPALLLFCVVIFAQWKARRLQILISIAALICLVIMQSVHRSGTVVTLEDLWLSATLIHIVCILLIDLTLPSGTLRYAAVIMDDNSCRSIQSDGNDLATVMDMKRIRVEQKPSSHQNCSSIRSTIESTNILDECYPSSKKPSSHHLVSHLPMGTRKRIALSAILICYVTFVVLYLCFVATLIT